MVSHQIQFLASAAANKTTVVLSFSLSDLLSNSDKLLLLLKMIFDHLWITPYFTTALISLNTR